VDLGGGNWLHEVTIEDEWRGGISYYDSPDAYDDSLLCVAVNPDLHTTVENFSEMVAFLTGGYTVVTGLKVQLKETDGTNYGDVLSTGGIDLGNGNWLWYIEELADFRGVAVLFDGTTWSSANTVAVVNVNQQVDAYDITTSMAICRFHLADQAAQVWSDTDIEKALVLSTDARTVADGVPLLACALLYDSACASAAIRARIQRASIFSIDYTKLPTFLREQAAYFRAMAAVYGGSDVVAAAVNPTVQQVVTNIPSTSLPSQWGVS
jgi:hypothetical protein